MNFMCFSAVVFEDKSITTVTDQDLVCTIRELSQDTPIIWVGPDNIEISDSDTNNYVIDQGNYIFGNKAATLTIKTAKMSTLSSGSVFKCQLKSSKYPTHSPDVVKEMSLSFFTLGLKAHQLMIISLISYRSKSTHGIGFSE